LRRWFVDLAIALGAWGTREVDPVAHLAFTIAECRCLPLMTLPGLGLVVVLTARIFVTEREREREREREIDLLLFSLNLTNHLVLVLAAQLLWWRSKKLLNFVIRALHMNATSSTELRGASG